MQKGQQQQQTTNTQYLPKKAHNHVRPINLPEADVNRLCLLGRLGTDAPPHVNRNELQTHFGALVLNFGKVFSRQLLAFFFHPFEWGGKEDTKRLWVF